MTGNDELVTRNWLNRAFRAEKKAQALQALVQQRRENATGLVRNSEGNDKGKSDTSKNGTENSLIQLVDVEEKFQKCKAEAERVTDEIFKAISSLNDDELEAVLINRYLNYMTIEKTAEFMGYDVSTVKRKVKKAIEKLRQNELVCASLNVLQ